MQIIGYVILVIGVLGIALGLYGLVVPSARRRGFAIKLPLPGRGGEDVDKLIAELEETGFRASPFEARVEDERKKGEPDLKSAPARFASRAIRPERVAKALNVEGIGPLPEETPKPIAAAPASPAPSPSGIRTVRPLHEDASPKVIAVEAAAQVATQAEAAPLPSTSEVPVRTEATKTPDDADATETEEELDPVIAELIEEINEEFEQAAALEEAEAEAGEGEGEEKPAGDPLSDDLLSLFEESVAESTTSQALRDAIPEVTIEQLLEEARETRQLMADNQRVA